MSVDVVYDCPLGANTLRQVTQSQFSEGIEVLAGRMSGAPNISDQFVQSANPVGEFTSTDIGGFLAALSAAVGGALIADGSTVKIPYHKRASGSTFAGGSSNLVINGIAGNPVFICPQSVTAPAMGACTAQGQCHFLSADGITLPYAVAANQALASQLFVAMYGLGPVFVNSIKVPRQIGYTVNFGIGLSEKKHYDGAPYPSDIFIEEFNPSIEVNQEDFDYLTGIAGGAVTSIECWMRKRASGGTYVDDAEEEHLTFGFAAGFIRSQQVSANDTKNGQLGVQMLGRSLVIGNGVALGA